MPRLDSDRPQSIDWEIGSGANHAISRHPGARSVTPASPKRMYAGVIGTRVQVSAYRMILFATIDAGVTMRA